MRADSLDLRARIVQAVERGMSQPEAAALLRVGERRVKHSLYQWRTTGALAAHPRPGRRPVIGPDPYPALLAQLSARPDATLEEHCERWHEAAGVAVSPSTWCRLKRRIGWRHKKSR